MGPRFLLLTIVGAPGVGSEGEGLSPQGIGWRLLGPNNRELGRSARVLGSLDDCREQFRVLRESIGEAVSSCERGSLGLGWWWRLHIKGVPVARAGRLFQRERECQYSVTQFVAAVPVAVVKWPSTLEALPRVHAVAFAGRTGALLGADGVDLSPRGPGRPS